ncbi:FAD-dependent monooxygenase [Hyphomicrobium sp.]|uniref:FAD-dependent monooxygenase n=1 Tax=Hyphomicrobium sp. TaxID=82 RepID=UPI000FB7E2D0|nr:FAD-dependent monooxygenase [Hyphomicrobium sp.]RUO99019.1 MAG: FAD-binding protein [Hyphomicrobium sp.]
MTKDIFDIAVAGAGPAGLAAGLAAAKSGLRTVVIGPPPSIKDRRTSALFGGSIELLKKLANWERIEPQSAPLRGIRIVDAGTSFLRAPEVLFEARDAGLEAFGFNIPNLILTEVLEDAAESSLTRLHAAVATISIEPDQVDLATSAGTEVFARLVVAADGRASSTRSAAGIEVAQWDYPQSALVASFAHTRDHRGISTELHRHVGPLTVVPGPGLTSNLVWIDTPDEVARLQEFDDATFIYELEQRLRGLLGRLSEMSPRQSFRLSGQTAKCLARNRVIVAGEAAHVIPPIGAQGLNLSFRDAATIADIIGEARESGSDIGGEATLSRYDKARRADIGTRVFAVDVLNRSLLSNIPGVSLARGLGLFALASSPSLRARVMREGITPFASNPRLMHSDVSDFRAG